ncbi:MAG: ABC transporter ATP-binding protein [Prevotellaceae bacterium]|jgi:lipoprotein-releasing system ATP-binding protein|nr:ABC transporter ATP-binding protein [Prevotellaceae bacterium]
MIKAENINKSFGTLQVLKGIDLTIARGELVSIIGPSGAGKSTFLQIAGTLSRPDAGKIFIDEVDVFALKSDSLASFRNQRIGFVFQFHHLLPEFTAIENVCIPGFIAKKHKSAVEKRAKELLDYLGLASRFTHKPGELSGGEQQRVAVARALINEPSIILADEPSGNLDTYNRNELHSLFFRLRDELGQTIVIVTHDEHLTARSDRTLAIIDGKIKGDSGL